MRLNLLYKNHIQHNVIKIFNQLNYWYYKSGNGFYKFLKPCNHIWYRKGDSWCEELKLSENTIRKYLKIICSVYNSYKFFKNKKNAFIGKPFLSYFDRTLRITRFFKNPYLPLYQIRQTNFFEKTIINFVKKSENCASNCVSSCIYIYSNNIIYKYTNKTNTPFPPFLVFYKKYKYIMNILQNNI